MISLKTARELERMRKATTISAQALRLAGERLEAGMSTYELDMIIRYDAGNRTHDQHQGRGRERACGRLDG